MASARDLQAKAKRLLQTWKRQLDGELKKDERSPVTHLCMTILMRNSSYKTARSAELALRERFADWNEIRVSPIAEVVEVLEEAKVPGARAKAFALRRFLRDLFSKYTKTNLNFDKLIVPDAPVVIVPKEGAQPAAAEEESDDDDEPVSRESGLPPHPTVPGYVDGDKIMGEPIPLDPKLIVEKNGIHVAGIAYDDATRAPFAAIWKVALANGLVEPELGAIEALGRLRQVMPEKEPAAFAFYAIVYSEENWAEITKKADALREKYGPVDKDEEKEVEEEEKKAVAKK